MHQIATAVIDQIDRKSIGMNKPTVDEIKNELDIMGMSGPDIDEATKQILDKVDKITAWKPTP